jgi:hypothetical protein
MKNRLRKVEIIAQILDLEFPGIGTTRALDIAYRIMDKLEATKYENSRRDFRTPD